MLLVQHRVKFVDPGTIVGGVSPEGDSEHVQKFVHSVHQALGRVGHALHAGLSLVDDDLIGQVGRHDEVVFDHKGSLLVVEDEPLEHSRADDSLLAVQVGRGLVDEVGVSALGQRKDDGYSLQLSS